MSQKFGNPFNTGVSRFGGALATGDVVGTTVADLVIGAPSEAGGVGGVIVYTGAASAITFAQHLLNGDAVSTDGFGFSVAVADFKGGAKLDIIVGIPGEAIGVPQEGAIWTYIGSSGATVSSDGFRTQGEFYGVSATDTILPTEKLDIGFGTAIAGGNFNGVAGAEVVVAGPFDDPAQNGTLAGAVFVFKYDTIADAQKIDQVTTRYGDDHF